MKFIKDFFIRRSINDDLDEKVKLLHPQYHWSIVYDLSTEPYINRLKKKLQEDFHCKDHNLRTIGIKENDKSMDYLSYDSFDLLGNLNTKYFDVELVHSCEHLIFYTENESLFHKYLQSRIKNNFQIGLSSFQLNHNLTIKVNAKETDIFVNELKNYLSKIKFKHEAV